MNIKHLAFAFFLLLPTLGCDNVYTLSESVPPALTFNEFQQQQGFQLDYELFFPSSINNWQQSNDYKFTFNAEQKVYWLKNIDLSQVKQGNGILTFKISNADWHHQFGFGRMRINSDDSVYSAASIEGVVFNIIYSHNASNLSLELPNPIKANFVSFAIKISSDTLYPSGLIYTQLTKSPI